MTDFFIALWALLVGLDWLWAFLLFLVIACLATTGGVACLDVLDRELERWNESRGRVRAVNPATGREEWVRRG